MSELSLTKTRLKSGRYEGLLMCTGTPPVIEAVHLDRVLGHVELTEMPDHPGHHLAVYSIPSEVVGDSVQTIQLRSADDGEALDRITILAGDALEDDIRAEMVALRDELELLKRAFRRHCVETGAD